MFKQRHLRRTVSAVLLMSVAAIAAAGGKGLPRYGVAVYSDLCVESESGDVGGQRISLHRFADGDSVIYEFTAGGLSMPLVASDVSIDDGTGVLTFTVTVADNEERTIIGRFAKDGRTLTLTGSYDCSDVTLPMRLRRVDNFSRPLAACRACPVTPSAAPAA
jgi:hypothetical protein